MNFEITPSDLTKIAAWKAQLDKKNLEKQKQSMSAEDFEALTANGKFPYTGAIGGDLTYEFTPHSLGVTVRVIDALSQEVLDITDYDNW